MPEQKKPLRGKIQGPLKKKKLSSYRAKIRGNIFTAAKKYSDQSALNRQRGIARAFDAEKSVRNVVINESSQTVWETFKSRIIFDNPVLFNALGIALITAFSSTVRKAWTITLVIGVLLITVETLASLIYKKIRFEIRIAAYVLTASVVFLPLGTAILNRYPEYISNIGLYLPLACVSGLITARAELFAIKHSPAKAFADGLGNVIGFALIAIPVGAVREFLSVGAVAESYVTLKTVGASINLPFFTFLLLGILSAAAQGLRNRYIKNKTRDNNKSERR